MAERLQVGVIGIGLLGQAFVHRLRGAGFEVVGFDVDPAKTTKLADLGGHTALSVADLARRCDPIVLAVFSTDQVEAVVESELLPALARAPGRLCCAPARATPNASLPSVSALPRAGCAFWKPRSRARADR